MTRIIFGIVALTVSLLLAHQRASAPTEFCPAHLDYDVVSPGLYGFELAASGPRTITSASLLFDTIGGWYAVIAPGTVLYEKDRHYTGPSSAFVRR